MVFSSPTFLFLFLPLFLLFYFGVSNREIRNGVVVVFSLIFYAWGEPAYIILMVASVFLNYMFGRVIETNRGNKTAKCWFIISIIINLSFIGFFKYGRFFVENLNFILPFELPEPQIKHIVGISFYTFQIMSYVIDVYRKDVRAQNSFPKLLLYVSMFPQLIAGPIVRYSDIAEEIDHRTADSAEISRGITRFIIGLSKKVIIADYAYSLLTPIMGSGSDFGSLSVMSAWFGVIMFAIQMYFDFSGYSDMAIGLGLMMGFHFKENFDHPYIANSITDFWRRWHISLSGFFRDYVYIPMGGNRRHRTLNLLVVWSLTGLWHGASWNFILWGLYFFVLLIIEKAFLLKYLKKIPKIFSHIYALFFILIGWVIFYFHSPTQIWDFMGALFGADSQKIYDTSFLITIQNNIFWIAVAIFFCIPIKKLIPIHSSPTSPKLQRAKLLRDCSVLVVNALLIFICTMVLISSNYHPFIYFQF